MAPHSSTLAWKIPWTEEPGRLQSMGSLRVRHNRVTSLSFSLSCIGEGNGNPLQCSCLENPREGGAWWPAVYGVAQSQTWLKRLSSSSSSRYFREELKLWRKPVLGKPHRVLPGCKISSLKKKKKSFFWMTPSDRVVICIYNFWHLGLFLLEKLVSPYLKQIVLSLEKYFSAKKLLFLNHSIFKQFS